MKKLLLSHFLFLISILSLPKDLFSQNVGIGTTTPLTKLHVESTTSNIATFNGGASMWITLAETGINRGYIGSFAGNPEDVDFGTYAGSTGKVHLTTNNTPRLTVTSAGSVGINLTNPTSKLEIRGALGFSSSIKKWEMNYDSTAGYFYIDEFGAGRRFFIKDGGNIGIGQSNPFVPLNFASTLGNKISLWGNTTNHYGMGIQAMLMQFYTAANTDDIAFGYGNSNAFTENMRIKGNGNVGVGTTNPSEKFEVNGAINIGNTTNDLPGSIRFNNSNNDFEGFDGTQWRSLTATGIFAPAQSDTGYSQQAGDGFGYAVKMIDDYLFVGAPNADVNGNANQGTVTIYKKNNFTNKYEIIQTISSPDGTAGDQFGTAIDATILSTYINTYQTYYLMIGAPKKTVSGHASQGAVYLFVQDYNSGDFRFTTNGSFSPADGAANDQFGTSILVNYRNQDNLYFYAGAPLKTVNGNIGQGRVYNVKAAPGSGADASYLGHLVQDDIVDAPYALPFGLFGYSMNQCPCDYLVKPNTGVRLCDNTPEANYKMIGAPGAAVNGNTGRGKVFGYVGATYDTAIIATDGAVNDNFGISISLAKQRVYIGASGKQVGANTVQGKVYVLKDTSTTTLGVRSWREMYSITAADGQANDHFGYYVNSNENNVMIGSINRDNTVTDAGAVYVFERSPGYANYTHTLRKIITDPAGQAQNFMGKTFDIIGNNYVIGVPEWDNPGRSNSGKIIFGTIY